MDEKLLYACMGKSKSAGGLNLPEMKKGLIKKFPKHKEEINKMNRKQLTNYCRKNFGKEIQKSKEKYFVHNSSLNKQQMKYCRCLAHIAAKNPEWCYEHGAWKKTKGKCYNPYSVCTKSTKRKGRFYCNKYYDFDNMPEKEVKSLALLKGISVSELKRKAAKERRDYPEKVYY